VISHVLSAAKAKPRRSDSRKGAKGAKEKQIFTWRSWRPFDLAQDMLGASKSPFWIATGTGKFAQAGKTLKYSSVVQKGEDRCFSPPRWSVVTRSRNG
jgi:hypothetical protein